MPGKVYVKGFVKSYAKYLDIENDEEIEKFLDSDKNNTDLQKESILSPQKIEVNNKGISKRYVTILMGIIAIALLFGVQSFYTKYIQNQPSKNTEKTPAEINPPNEEPPAEVPQEEAPEEEPVKKLPDTVGMSIEIMDVGQQQEACWLQIYTDANLSFEGTLYEGDLKIIEAKERIKITLGNAGVAKLTLGEKELGTLGKIGEVLTKEFTKDDLQ